MIKIRIGEMSLDVDPIPAAIAACMIIGTIAALQYLRRTAGRRPEVPATTTP